METRQGGRCEAQLGTVTSNHPGQLDDRELAHVAGTYLDQLEKQLKSEVTRNESYYDDGDRDLRCHILERFKRVADLTSASWDEASRACTPRV